jgi:hypothetical protein
VTVTYIAALVANNEVKRYLAKHHQNLLMELQQLSANKRAVFATTARSPGLAWARGN